MSRTYNYKPGFKLADHWTEDRTDSLRTIAQELRGINEVLRIAHAPALVAHEAERRAQEAKASTLAQRAACRNCTKWDYRRGGVTGLCMDARRLGPTRADDFCPQFTDKETA